MAYDDTNERLRFDRLTGRQRECLELVLQRRTSKQIARILGISKPAVDQRLTTARQQLNVSDRDEAALLYARLLATYDRVAYDSLQLPPVLSKLHEPGRECSATSEMVLNEAPTSFRDFVEPSQADWQVLGVSANQLSPLARVFVMVGLTVAILASVLIGLAVSQSISGLMIT